MTYNVLMGTLTLLTHSLTYRYDGLRGTDRVVGVGRFLGFRLTKAKALVNLNPKNLPTPFNIFLVRTHPVLFVCIHTLQIGPA